MWRTFGILHALIAATTAAALGQVVQGLGEFAEVALPKGRPRKVNQYRRNGHRARLR